MYTFKQHKDSSETRLYFCLVYSPSLDYTSIKMKINGEGDAYENTWQYSANPNKIDFALRLLNIYIRCRSSIRF